MSFIWVRVLVVREWGSRERSREDGREGGKEKGTSTDGLELDDIPHLYRFIFNHFADSIWNYFEVPTRTLLWDAKTRNSSRKTSSATHRIKDGRSAIRDSSSSDVLLTIQTNGRDGKRLQIMVLSDSNQHHPLENFSTGSILPLLTILKLESKFELGF